MIKEDGVTVRNFVPAQCYRDAETLVAGVYDTANGKFYPSAGTDEFLAGPEASVGFTRDEFAAARIYGGSAETYHGEAPSGKEVSPGADRALAATTREAAAGQAGVVKVAAVEKEGRFYATVVIDETKIASIDETLAEIGASIADVAEAEAGAEVALTLASEKTTPGLYYSIVSDTEVDGAYATEGGRVLAEGKQLTLEAVRPSGDKAFFKAKASLTDK